MPDRQVDLPGAIHLIPSLRLADKLAEQRARYPFLPDVDGIRRDLSMLASRGPVPARVESGRGGRGDFLKIYVDGRYVLTLNVTKRANGYSVSGAFPMGFEHHDEIVRGTLRVQAPAWILHHGIKEMPFEAGAYWDFLREQWRLLNQDGPSPAAGEPSLPKTHEEYLDVLDEVIEEGRRAELAAARTDGMISYRRVEASAARRRFARSVHDFLLIGSHRPLVGARLHIRNSPDLRGRVDQLRGTLMTVRFERPVDLDAIPRVGAFVESPSTIPFDRQAEAVRLLRDGRSANPHLLDALAGHRFRPFTPPAAEPARALDESQRSAFRKALGVPDVGLILGPPGTGKTRTITEIARASAAAGERVLVTSYTNRAVDNVLQELPTDLVVLRVGREDGVTPGCEHLTLEEQAATLQGEILRRTEAAFRSYASADPDRGEADGWLRQLDASIHALREAEAARQQAADALQRRAAQLTARVDEQARGLAATADEHRRELHDHDARLAALAGRRDRAEARTRWLTPRGPSLLAYSAVSETRDEHLERLCLGWPALTGTLGAGDPGDPRAEFGGWLAERDIDPARLQWTDAGALRLTLPASRFNARTATTGRKGTFALVRLGSYITFRSHVLQLWCDDPRLRREAVLDRALNRVTASRKLGAAEAEEFLARLSAQLETPPVTVDDLRRHAHHSGETPLPF